MRNEFLFSAAYETLFSYDRRRKNLSVQQYCYSRFLDYQAIKKFL